MEGFNKCKVDSGGVTLKGHFEGTGIRGEGRLFSNDCLKAKKDCIYFYGILEAEGRVGRDTGSKGWQEGGIGGV